MPYSIGYNPSILTNVDIGYTPDMQAYSVGNGFFGDAQHSLASILLPNAGVYLVEGQIEAIITNVSSHYYIGLSNTNNVIDARRVITIHMNNASGNGSTYGHLSSVFKVDVSTTIYFIGRIYQGTSNTTTAYMTYTRLG